MHPVILAAAQLLGVDEVYAMGGAGAIGAFAHGVAELGLDPVDVVTGPGNNFVASAKRAVAGLVGTDAEAGATEILIVADATADARLDRRRPRSARPSTTSRPSAVLVTDSEPLADAVAAEIAPRAAAHPPRRARRRRPGGPAVRDRPGRRPRRRRRRSATPTRRSTSSCTSPIRAPRTSSTPAPSSSGADSPVSLGDYLAGSNHVLPDRRAGALLRRASRPRRSCARSR